MIAAEASTLRRGSRCCQVSANPASRANCPKKARCARPLPSELCTALRAAGAPQVARLLAAGAWGWMGDQLRFWTATARAGMREPQLEMLGSPLIGLLEAADGELRDEIVTALPGYGDNVLGCLMPVLRSAAVLPAATRRAAGLDAVARGLRATARRDHRAAAA
jgi:hypothetical protein